MFTVDVKQQYNTIQYLQNQIDQIDKAAEVDSSFFLAYDKCTSKKIKQFTGIGVDI